MAISISDPKTSLRPKMKRFYDVFATSLYRLGYSLRVPNGKTMSNQRRFDVDITSIRRRPNFYKFPHHFHALFLCNFADLKIHVVSTYLIRCNINSRKIHVVSTYFVRCNFAGRKIHVVSTYFFPCDFDGRNMDVVCTYFIRRNFDGQEFHIIFGKL